MRDRPTVGLVFPPARGTLALLAPALARCEHLEVVPETLWSPGERFEPNLYFDAAVALVDRLGVPVLAHGVGLCTTTADPRDTDRQRRWLDRLAETHRRLPFAWVTEHSGATVLAGDNLALPVAVPWTTRSRDVLRARLADLRSIVGCAGIEHSAFYVLLDAPEAEAPFLCSTLADDGWLVLDLHNLLVLERNHGFPAEQWLADAPLHRVIEVHVSGGRPWDAFRLERTFHLDSHDDAVPERVWQLLDAVLPYLPALRAITVERLEGTVADAAEVAALIDELDRARAAAERWTAGEPLERIADPLPIASDEEHLALDEVLAEALRAVDPRAVLVARMGSLSASMKRAATRALADPEALRLTRLLIAQLRFSQLLNGSATAHAAFEADPSGFTARFRAYHQEVRPSAFDPEAEARRFERYERRS